MKKLVLSLALLSSAACAQTRIDLSASATTVQPGQTVTITESLFGDGRSVVGYQRQLTSAVGTFAGPTVLTAGKSAQCNGSTCLLIGLDTSVTPNKLNSTVLPSSPIMSQVLTIPTTAKGGTFQVAVSNIVAVDPNGTVVPVSAGAALTITVTVPISPFDLNRDGVIDVTDVGLAITQALGIGACATGDVNADGKCNIQDVQQVIHAAGF